MALQVLQKAGLILISLMLIFSCSNENKEKELEDKNKALEEQIDYLLQNARYKDELISSIDEQLDSINASFIYLNANADNPSFDEEADRIFIQIEKLKEDLEDKKDSLRNADDINNRLINENEKLLQVIERYKLKVIAKEKQILDLQRKLKDKTDKNKKQRIIINRISDDIARKKTEIRRLEKNLIRLEAEAYEKISTELYSIANNLPDVKGWFTKKTKREVARIRYNLRNDARRYKNKADNLWSKYYE
jgi:chromosome segregation ATPase